MSFSAVFLAVRLLLGGWLKRARKGLSALARFARRNPWRACALFLVLCCAICVWRLDRARDHANAETLRANQAQARFVAQKAGFHKLVGLMKAARKEAARLDRINKQRVKAETDAKIRKVVDDADTERDRDLTALRERLRGGRGPSGDGVECRSGGGEARLPSLSTLPGETLRLDRAAVVDAHDAELCTINTLRLEALVRAWREVSEVDVNGGPQKGQSSASGVGR